VGQPELVRWAFTALFAGISLTYVVRLLTNRRNAATPPRHDDVWHAVMGIAMIAMMLSWLSLLPTTLWVVLFGGQAVFFAAILLRNGSEKERTETRNWDHTHHFVGSMGMLYMVVAMTGPKSGMPGMSPLAVSFGVYFLAYALWSGLRAVQPAPVAVTGGSSQVLSTPLLVHGCRALMGGGMAYLLLAS
jgi:hypothetical protein